LPFFDILDPSALGEPRRWNNGLLAPAGGRLRFVAGQTTDRDEYLRRLRSLGGVWRRVMTRHYPVMALVIVSALVDEGAKVEATAAIPADSVATSEPAGDKKRSEV
jgi:hypothetical protein